MYGLKKEIKYLETRDEITAEIKPAMLRVSCPLRAGCPYFGEIRPVGKKRRCYGRLFDLAKTNGVVWLRYQCQRTKQVMVMKQMGSKMYFGDGLDLKHDQVVRVPKKFQQIRCPICGQWILDVYEEAGGFLFEFKCPTHRNVVRWCGASQSHWGYNDENAECA